MNCEGSKLGWLGRSSNGNRRRRWQVDLVSRGDVGLALTDVGLARSWVSHSLTLCLSPSRRYGSLSLSVTATPTRASESDQDGSLYSLSLSRSSHLSLSFLFFFFFSLCFLLSLFGFGLLKAKFFFFRLTWVMGSALSWLDDGLGEGGVHDFWERGRS